MRDKVWVRRAVAALAASQHGVVAATQLREHGLSRKWVHREVAIGRLHPLHKGVYAVGHTAISEHGRCLGAVLSCGTASMASHRAAAWLLGVAPRLPRTVDVIVPTPRQPRAECRPHVRTSLEPRDSERVAGIPTTSLAWTLLDIAASESIRSVAGMLIRAARLDLLDLGAIDDLLTRSRGRRGVARLRVALEPFRIAAFTRSGVERAFLRLLGDHGIPRPATNLFVEGYEIDAFWERERLAIELDTYAHHGDPRAFEADRLRDEDLRLRGIETIRITGARLERTPALVARRVRLHLDRRRRELGLVRPADSP